MGDIIKNMPAQPSEPKIRFSLLRPEEQEALKATSDIYSIRKSVAKSGEEGGAMICFELWRTNREDVLLELFQTARTSTILKLDHMDNIPEWQELSSFPDDGRLHGMLVNISAIAFAMLLLQHQDEGRPEEIVPFLQRCCKLRAMADARADNIIEVSDDIRENAIAYYIGSVMTMMRLYSKIAKEIKETFLPDVDVTMIE